MGAYCEIRLVWGFLCQAASTPFLSCFVIPFFCSTRAASILSSRPHVSITVRAQRRSRTALLQRRRRLVLDGREHGGKLPAIGGVGRAMIRGEPAIGREQSREPRLYSVEPTWGLDHEAVIRFCGQGSEAAGPFFHRESG